MSETNYAFIDSQNLNLAIRDQGWKLDFQKFRIYLREKYNVQKAFIFIGYIPKYHNLYENLKSFGYVLIFKPIVVEEGKVKGNIDAELVLYCMIEFLNYDKGIIISGDGDFYCLVNYLKVHNKLCKLIVPNIKKYSFLFKVFKNDIHSITFLKEKLEYKKDRH